MNGVHTVLLSLCLVDRASFLNILFLFQLDILFYFSYIFTIFFLQFSLHVSDRLVHHQENQITRAASGAFPWRRLCNVFWVVIGWLMMHGQPSIKINRCHYDRVQLYFTFWGRSTMNIVLSLWMLHLSAAASYEKFCRKVKRFCY